MKTHAVLSILGRDRVGVADDLVATLAKRGLEINENRMTVLGGRFAILAEVSADEDDMTSLRSDLATVSADLGFRLQLEPHEISRWSEKVQRVTGPQAGVEVLIESFSSEPSGLNAITGILRRRHANIEALETEVSSAPSTSEMTFHTTARAKIPMACSVEELGQELHELERGRDLEILIKRASGRAEVVDA